MSGPFKVGDVVVCVNARPDESDPKAALLSEGVFYRVAVCGHRSPDQVLSLAFRCLPDPQAPGKGYAFSAHRFRHLPKADERFTAKIRACRPIKRSVDA